MMELREKLTTDCDEHFAGSKRFDDLIEVLTFAMESGFELAEGGDYSRKALLNVLSDYTMDEVYFTEQIEQFGCAASDYKKGLMAKRLLKWVMEEKKKYEEAYEKQFDLLAIENKKLKMEIENLELRNAISTQNQDKRFEELMKKFEEEFDKNRELSPRV